MQKVLCATIIALAALSLAACAVGKGKGVPVAPPPVVTKG